MYNTAYSPSAVVIDTSAMFKLSYGLFVLTARDGDKDNGCIINTATQLTQDPLQISITVNKSNLTHDMILKTGLFSLSVLSTSTPFSIFQQFGFQSGKNADKFKDAPYDTRSADGVRYLPTFANSVISARVSDTYDCGTHTLFIASVIEAAVLSQEPSVTYQYYFDNIKPKPEVKESKELGYVCKICGYIYEGEPLPPDFICPICKHGAVDFEKL